MSPKTLRVSSLALALVATASAGCGSDFDPASLVTRPRLVGGRVHVAADDTRAAPLPGEDVTLDLWLVQPSVPSEVRATHVVCAAANVTRGASSCASAPIALVPATGASFELAPLTFTVPDAASLAGATQLLVVSATCDHGALPSVDVSTFLPTCDDASARAELSTQNIPLTTDATTANHHPSIVDESYALGGRAWLEPPDDLALTGCASLGDTDALPLVVVGPDAAPPDADDPFTVEFSFTTSEDDRETYTAVSSQGVVSEAREALQFSHYANAGELQRAFSAVETTDTAGTLSIDWTPPARDALTEDGLVVRFTWVVRDLRGGFDRAERALCVVRGS